MNNDSLDKNSACNGLLHRITKAGAAGVSLDELSQEHDQQYLAFLHWCDQIVRKGDRVFIAPQRQDVQFGDVKPGEEFVYATSLYAARGVKLTHVVTIPAVADGVSMRANIAILNIMGDVVPMKLKDRNLDYLENQATVAVYR